MERQRVRVKARSVRMIATSVNVVPFRRPPDKEVLAVLEAFQGLTSDGSLKAIAVAGVHHDGAITTGFATNLETVALLGALSVVSNRLNRKFEAV